ncbi:hypothetical protein [Methylovulum psychrotolerans]|uniref:hypothetical protein n=1 Tax=Methylovulum psychrotolerans TaxID=1704499 RepID=UPI0012FA43BA|nr:hypothetical protein [Methylovulum psychrotolerans]
MARGGRQGVRGCLARWAVLWGLGWEFGGIFAVGVTGGREIKLCWRCGLLAVSGKSPLKLKAD